MHLHIHILIRFPFYMMITSLPLVPVFPCKIYDTFAPAVNPNIYITRSTCQRIGIHQRIALPFQYARTKAFLCEPLADCHCSLVYFMIPAFYQTTRRRPFKNNSLRRPLCFRQFFQSSLTQSCQCLLLCHIHKHTPFFFGWGT